MQVGCLLLQYFVFYRHNVDGGEVFCLFVLNILLFEHGIAYLLEADEEYTADELIGSYCLSPGSSHLQPCCVFPKAHL